MRRIVTIAVVAVGVVVLAGISVVLVGRSRAAAERARCLDNLRRICKQYLLDEAQTTKSFPAGTVVVDPKTPPERRLSWVVPGLTRLGHAELSTSIDVAAPWDDAANRSAAGTCLVHLVCPAVVPAVPADGRAPLYYPGIAGVGADAATTPSDRPGAGLFRYDTPTTVAEVKDGQSYTLMLIESGNQPGPWIAGGPTSVRPLVPAKRPYLGPGRPFGGCHFGGANVAFADGSGRFLADAISPTVLERLATIADGDKPLLSNP